VIKTTSPTVVSLCILLEVPAAALIAALWLGQVPSWAMVPGAVLILAGLAVVVGSSSGENADSTLRGTDHAGVPETADVTHQ
jgi:drug/metabolite transporter (DMT)-like permease